MPVCPYVKASFFVLLSSRFALSHPLNQEREASISKPPGCIVYVNARDGRPVPNLHATGSPKPCDDSNGIVKRTVTVSPTPEPSVTARGVEFLDLAPILVRNGEPEAPTTTLTPTTIQTIVHKQETGTDYVNARRTAIPEDDAEPPSPTQTGCPGAYVNARGEPVDPSTNPHLDVRHLKCLPFRRNVPETIHRAVDERDAPQPDNTGSFVNARRAVDDRDISQPDAPVNARRAAEAEPTFSLPHVPDQPSQQTHTNCPGGYINARGVPVENAKSGLVNARGEELDPDSGEFLNARDNQCTPPLTQGGATAKRTAPPMV